MDFFTQVLKLIFVKLVSFNYTACLMSLFFDFLWTFFFSVRPAQGQVLYTVPAETLSKYLSRVHTRTQTNLLFLYRRHFILSSVLVFQIVEQGKNAKSYHYILANLVSHYITAFLSIQMSFKIFHILVYMLSYLHWIFTAIKFGF